MFKSFCKFLVAVFFAAIITSPAYGLGKLQGYVEQGGNTVTTGLFVSTTKVQKSFPSATVTVYNAGTVTLATIYSDNARTPKANPFTAGTDASWFFFAEDGDYDVRFSGGGISVPWTLSFLRILANQVVFNCRSYGALGNWNGTTGNDDTEELQACFDAASAATTSFQPSGGAYMGTRPQIVIPYGRYKLTASLVPPAYATITGEAQPILEQTTVGQQILAWAGAYDISVKGIKFLKGSNQIFLTNENTNFAKFEIEDCEFQLSTDFAIYATGAISDAVSVAAGTVTVTNGSATVTGVGTTFSSFLFGSKIRVGGVNATVLSVASDTQLTLTANWSGSTAAGAAYRYVDAHLSALLTIDKCRFMYPRRALYNSCDTARLQDSWVQVSKTNFDAGTGVFRNQSGNLYLDEMFGVPEMGTGGARLLRPRWVDLYDGSFYADRTRFGGEDAGMGIVQTHGKYDDVYPFNAGTTISITNSEVSAGEAGVIGTGVVLISTESPLFTLAAIPQQIIYKGNKGLIDATIITNPDAISLTTKLATISAPYAKLRYELDTNQSVGGDYDANSIALKRFIQFGGPGAMNTNFVLVLTNTAGATPVQHRIFAENQNGSSLGDWAFQINGASTTNADTPSVTAAVDFTNGVGIEAIATSRIIFDVPDQAETRDAFLGAVTIQANTTGTDLNVTPQLYPSNVNGVTRYRLALTIGDSASGAAYDLTAIPDGALIAIRFMGRIK